MVLVLKRYAIADSSLLAMAPAAGYNHKEARHPERRSGLGRYLTGAEEWEI